MKTKHPRMAKKPEPAKTTNMLIRIDPKLYRRFKAAAAKDDRNLSSWVRLVLKKACDRTS